MPIVRLNWATTYCFTWEYSQAATATAMTPEEAAAAGAEAVLICLSLKTGSERQDAENVGIFCKLARAAHRCGLPVIGEYFPARGENVHGKELHEEIKIGARILAELGSDAIKTFHTEKFREVAAGCPVPVWGLGARSCRRCWRRSSSREPGNQRWRPRRGVRPQRLQLAQVARVPGGAGGGGEERQEAAGSDEGVRVEVSD